VIADFARGPTGMTAAIWSILDGGILVTRNREFIVRNTAFSPDGCIAKALIHFAKCCPAATRAGRRGPRNRMREKGTAS